MKNDTFQSLRSAVNRLRFAAAFLACLISISFDLVKGLMEIQGVSDIDYKLSKCSTNDSWMHNTLTLIEQLTNNKKRVVIKSMCQDVLLQLDDKDINEHIQGIESSIINLSRKEHGSIVELTQHLRDTIHLIEQNSLSAQLNVLCHASVE